MPGPGKMGRDGCSAHGSQIIDRCSRPYQSWHWLLPVVFCRSARHLHADGVERSRFMSDRPYGP